MTSIDWRQYKAKLEYPKGFKGLKPGQEEKNAPLKPLGVHLKPCRDKCENHLNSSTLACFWPLKPLKPKGGYVERNYREETGQFEVYAERWAERAAIKQFDGGASREQAEEEAAREYSLSGRLQELRCLVGRLVDKVGRSQENRN